MEPRPESSNESADTDRQQAVFDELARQMAEIHQASELSPSDHAVYYELALGSAYERACAQLAEHPELIKVYKAIGLVVLSASEDERQTVSSALRLQHYLDSGLVSEDQVSGIKDTALPSEFNYNPEEVEAFFSLFGDLDQEDENLETAQATDSEPNDEEDESEAFDDEINVLDVLEHLGQRGLSSAQLVLVQNALEFEPLKWEKLKKQEWALLSLSPQEWQELVDNFPMLRSQVINLLHEVDVPAKWTENGKGNNRSHQLLIGNAAEETKETDKAEAVKNMLGPNFEAIADRQARHTPTDTQTPAGREVHVSSTSKPVEFDPLAATFAVYLKTTMKEILLLSSDPRLTPIAGQIAKHLGITRLEARQAIVGLVDSGDLFYGPSKEGSRTLLSEQPDEPIAKHRQRKATEVISQAAFTDKEMHMARKLCQALIKARYQNKGLILAEAATAAGIDETELKQIASPMVERQLLVREVRRVKSRSGSRSRANRETTWLRFPTQEAWDAFRDNPDEYLKVMLEDRTNEEQQAGNGNNKKSDPGFEPDEIFMAGNVFDAVISVGHYNKGIPLNDLVRALGMENEDGRKFVARIVNRGLLIRDQAWERSRSPMSRRRETTLIKFPTQEAWKRFRQNPSDYLESLKYSA